MTAYAQVAGRTTLDVFKLFKVEIDKTKEDSGIPFYFLNKK
jgi:hypothetical protein